MFDRLPAAKDAELAELFVEHRTRKISVNIQIVHVQVCRGSEWNCCRQAIFVFLHTTIDFKEE